MILASGCLFGERRRRPGWLGFSDDLGAVGFSDDFGGRLGGGVVKRKDIILCGLLFGTGDFGRLGGGGGKEMLVHGLLFGQETSGYWGEGVVKMILVWISFFGTGDL